MALLAWALVIAIVGRAAWWLACHFVLRRRLSTLPAARSFPVIGHAGIIRPDPEGFLDQVMGMASLFPSPRLVLFWIGPKPSLMLYSAELIEPILSTSKHLNKGFAYDLLHPWLGLSLLTSDSAEWRPRRKLLTPTFHYDILKDFMPVFNHHSRILVSKLSSQPKGVPVDVLSALSLCALDAICETSMGKCVSAQENKDSEYVLAIHDVNRIIQERTTNPLVWIDKMFQIIGEGRRHTECLRILHGFTNQVIEERAKELEEKHWRREGRLAFLDLLLFMWHDGNIRWEDIQPEVDTFMFEGHDTTATALTWALHLIGNHPDVLARVQAEVDSVFVGEEVAVEDLARLKYLEACIKESLRLFPSVPIIMRKLGIDQEIQGTMVPAGTHILLNLFLAHRDPRHWPNPDHFDPDRFMGDKLRSNNFAFVPFSAGSRNCIGQRFAMMEEKTILAWVIRHFNIRSVERRFEVRSKIELIIRPQGGLHVYFEKRNL